MATEPSPLPIQKDPRWTKLLARDRSAHFFYAVRSTGIYCRVGCSARRPAPANVEFFETPVAAEQAGYRPCLRCRPAASLTASAARVRVMCEAIEQSSRAPTLAELGELVKLSPSQVSRVFKTATGVTPQSYHSALRRERVHRELSSQTNVTRAMYAAGFDSKSQLYRRAERDLGMSPRQYATKGKDMTIRYALSRCSLGNVLVATTARGVCAVLLGDDVAGLRNDLARRFADASIVSVSALELDLLERVIGVIDQTMDPPLNELPLDVRGTAFQERVWRALLQIPRGQTRSYMALAKMFGSPGASRAVANACAANPLAVLIPCHRVVRGDGSLSGYRWGVERKRQLLEREHESVRAAPKPRR